jgi:chlorobactene glucosyltransferase
MIVYQLLIAALLLGYLASLLINLRFFRTVARIDSPLASASALAFAEALPSEPTSSSSPNAAPKPAPFISVLVPARNEEHRIAPCASSLACQQYPNFEVLVLDDHSQDQTAAVLRGLGYGDEGKFRILTSTALPDGWTGKAWACHQLAQAAKGDYLLFLDADTEHHPAMLASALAVAQETNASLLSAWPRLVLGSWSEKLVLPIIHVSVVFYPFALWEWLLKHVPFTKTQPPRFWRRFGGANGQFLLFKRSAYDHIGGHTSVAQHMVEDVALGREVASRISEGLRLVNCDGSQISSVRMYTCLSEVWEGFTKNIRAVFEGNLSSYLFAGFLVNATLVLPFVFVAFTRGVEQQIVLAQIALIYLIRIILTLRFGTTWFGCIFHPFGFILATLIGLNSWYRSAGSGVSWKGRNYAVVHPVEER